MRGFLLPSFPTVFSATPSQNLGLNTACHPQGGLGRGTAGVQRVMPTFYKRWVQCVSGGDWQGGEGRRGAGGCGVERRGPSLPQQRPPPPPSRTGPRSPRPSSPSAEAGRSPRTRCHRPWRSLMVERGGEVWAPDPHPGPPLPSQTQGCQEQHRDWAQPREEGYAVGIRCFSPPCPGARADSGAAGVSAHRGQRSEAGEESLTWYQIQ